MYEFRSEVKEEFADVRGEIAEVRSEVAEVRGEVADLRKTVLTDHGRRLRTIERKLQIA
jgi:uncharacterized coiled-coil DUF342 family protein